MCAIATSERSFVAFFQVAEGYKCGGEGCDALDGHNQAAVFLDSFDMAFGSFEWAIDDPDFFAHVVVGLVVTQKGESLLSGGAHEDEYLHFPVGDAVWNFTMRVGVYPKPVGVCILQMFDI